MMSRSLLFLAMCAVCLSARLVAAEEPLQDEINPLLPVYDETVPDAPPPADAAKTFSSLFEDASLRLGSTYYGRSRHANNRGKAGAGKSPGEIHVNAFGQSATFRSGYAWGLVGFDVAGLTNLGRGRGTSEVLLHKEPGNRDRSSVSLGEAALKTRLPLGDLVFEARGGFTPIGVGSLGTSGGLHTHAYRGFETRLRYKDFSIGYGWADQFRNEWDHTYRDMYNAWHQNRYTDHDGRRISYVHSLGGRYEFGMDKAGFVDVGVGEGLRYRRNAQAVVSVPIDLGDFGVLTLTGYGIVAKYRELFATDRKRATEYHVSGSAQLKTGLWTFMTGLGHTRAPDSWEMQFRLTAWGNSDNRNYIQTWAQLDDFVWDGQSVVKAGAKYEIGKRICLPGLSVGGSYNYGWNARNPGLRRKSNGWEINYHAEYAVQSGRLQGLALGVYAGHLHYSHNKFNGKQNRNDVKVILSYSKTLENFLRWRK